MPLTIWAALVQDGDRHIKIFAAGIEQHEIVSRTMFIVGLTGGIATGKSTVSKIFEDLGCQVIDADQIAREGRT